MLRKCTGIFGAAEVFFFFFLLSMLLCVTLLEARENSSSQQEDLRICVTLRENLCFRLCAYAPLTAAFVH